MEHPFAVDFHCHVFPDALAPKAMARMTAELKDLYKPASDGTVAGLLANMKNLAHRLCGVSPRAYAA